MANNEDKLSRLYREGLGDFAKDPPPEVWSGIKQGLLIRNLIAFRFMTSLNRYSVATLITVAALAGFITGKQLYQKNDIVITTGKNIASIIKTMPNEPEINQNINQEHKNFNQEQKIEQATFVDQREINPIKQNQFQSQVNAPLHVIPKSMPPAEKPIIAHEIVTDPSFKKDNAIKLSEAPSEKPVIIDSSQKTDNGINPIVVDKQKTQPNQPIDKKKSETEQPKKQQEPVNDILTLKKPKTVQGFYAEIFGAPALLTFKYEQSTVNQNQTFVNSSKEGEKPALCYTAGLELGYGLKHIFAQTGINYSDYRSKTVIDLLSDNSFWTTTITKDSSFLYRDSMGNDHYEYILDTVPILSSGDTQITHTATNSLRYIEIPILIGYRFYSKRMSYAVLGGISIGYLSSSGGTTLNPDIKSVSLNTPKAVPYKPWTYYLILRAEAAYLIKKNLSVFIRPGFKYNMNSVFEDYYPVKKSFYTLDLHLGLRYNF